MKSIVIAIPTLTGGGAERVACLWANLLSHKGFEVKILALYRTEEEYFVDKDIPTFAITNNRDKYEQLGFINKIFCIRKILKEIKPDYIITFLPAMQVYVMCASLLMRVKRIETIRNNPWKINVGTYLNKVLWKFTYVTSYKTIIQSNDQAAFFKHLCKKRLIKVNNTISNVYKTTYRDDLSINVTSFIAVGRIVEQKNYYMMIDAFAEAYKSYPNIRLDIYGTGKEEYIDKIKNRISNLGMNEAIFLKGRIANIEKEYLSHDVFLMTSDYEGMPNALMEAMASRLICISTNCRTGPSDLIEDEINGYLVPVGNVEALEKKIKKVVSSDINSRNHMADMARKKIMNFYSEDSSLNTLCDMLQQ